MQQQGSLKEWIYPSIFLIAAGWLVWHMPAFILDFLPPESQSLFGQISELHQRKDVTPNMAGLFRGLPIPRLARACYTAIAFFILVRVRSLLRPWNFRIGALGTVSLCSLGRQR